MSAMKRLYEELHPEQFAPRVSLLKVSPARVSLVKAAPVVYGVPAGER